jgi:SEC-C motif-containing protein
LPLIAEHYPELYFGPDPVTGCEAFEGVLPLVAAKSGVVRRIPVRIIFPVGYPDDEPRAFEHTDRFLPHSPMRHFYSADGRCCLWLPWDSQWQPARHDGLLDFMAHLSIFFHHQLLFDVSGKWPVSARGHGRNGYREFLSETLGISHQEFPRFVPLLVDGARIAYLPCPCGSGKHAKRCHLVLVNKLISKIGRARLRAQVAWINEVTWPEDPAPSDRPSLGDKVG